MGLLYSGPFFLRKAELGFFHFLEIMTGWSVPSAGQKISVESVAGTLPPQKIPLAEKEVSSGK